MQDQLRNALSIFVCLLRVIVACLHFHTCPNAELVMFWEIRPPAVLAFNAGRTQEPSSRTSLTAHKNSSSSLYGDKYCQLLSVSRCTPGPCFPENGVTARGYGSFGAQRFGVQRWFHAVLQFSHSGMACIT